MPPDAASADLVERLADELDDLQEEVDEAQAAAEAGQDLAAASGQTAGEHIARLEAMISAQDARIEEMSGWMRTMQEQASQAEETAEETPEEAQTAAEAEVSETAADTSSEKPSSPASPEPAVVDASPSLVPADVAEHAQSQRGIWLRHPMQRLKR